jgi:hypothetical protein
MKNGLRRVLGRRTSLLVGLAAAVAAPLVFPGSALGQYVSAGAAVVPGNPLVSFDISWVDPRRSTRTFLLIARTRRLTSSRCKQTPQCFNSCRQALTHSLALRAGIIVLRAPTG